MATTSLSASTSSALASSSATAASVAASNKAAAQKLISSLNAGSGVDVASLAQNLVDAERVPKENAINTKIKKNESRISGYSAVSYVLSTVKTALAGLKDQKSFNNLSVANSNSSAFGVVASTTAAAASHSVEVTRLAKAQRMVSDGFANASASLNGGAGMSLSLTVGDSSVVTPTVTTTQGIAALTERTVLKFKALADGESVTVGGLTYTSVGASTAEDVAAAYAGLTNGTTPSSNPSTGTFSGTLVGFDASAATADTLTFTSATPGANVADLGVTTTATVAPDLTTTQGISAVTESSAVTFKEMQVGQSVTVAGLSFTATSHMTAIEVASAFAGLSASNTTPSATAKGTFSGNLTAFNAGPDMGTGRLTFTHTTPGTNATDISVAGATTRINLASGKDTPQDIVDAINATTTGVKAQLVDTGDGSASPFQIVLTGSEGVSNAFTFSTNYGVGTGSPGVVFNANNASNQAASDALIKVDGVSFTRKSNTISDVVAGVTFNLKATTLVPASIDLTRDTTAIKDSINSLVAAYNDSVTIFKEVSDPKSTMDTYGATLVGDSTVRNLKNQLRSMIMGTSSTPGTSISALWQMGVSIDQTGVMTVDSAKLDDVLANKFTDVVKAMTGNQNSLASSSAIPGGIAGDATKKLTTLLSNTGALLTQSESASSQNTKYKADLEKLSTRMTALLARYQKQFAAMDSLVGSVNTQKSSLKSTFDGMMASLTGKSG